MRLLFNILLLLTLSNFAAGQQKIKSFYFHTNKAIPTVYSQKQFAEFKRSVDKGMAKIIEINAFTDSTGTASSNDTLANDRLDYFTSKLNQSKVITLHAYGLQRPYPLPGALNWRRVDIIYEMSIQNAQDDIASSENGIVKVKSEEVDSIALKTLLEDPDVEDKNTFIEPSFQNSLTSATPFVLDIQFVEGTSKMTIGSDKEVKKLVEFLQNQPEVHAEIRGHVCCGNNMRISKARAKAVYKEVIKGGVEKERVSFVGKSNSEPLVFPEKTSRDRQLNRRVDVKFNLN